MPDWSQDWLLQELHHMNQAAELRKQGNPSQAEYHEAAAQLAFVRRHNKHQPADVPDVEQPVEEK